MKASELAERLHCRLEGDGDVELHRVAGIEDAQPGDLTFVSSPKYQSRLETTRASAVIVSESTPSAQRLRAILRAENPRLAFAQAIGFLVEAELPKPGVAALSFVDPSAALGVDVSIGPFVTIGAGASVGARSIIYPNVVIGPHAQLGEDCIVHSQVSIRESVRIGNRVVIQDGAVVGSDGFGFVKQADGSHFKIPQHADVVIEDDVEIGANTTIDRPAVGETRVGAGSKIDNLVQIAHSVKIGRRALFAAQVGIAGSTVVEDDVVLAGQVGVAGHLRLGRGVVATAQSGIPNSVGPGEIVSGYPAVPNREWLKTSAMVRQLPALRKRVAELEQRIAELGEQPAQCRTASDR